MANTISELAIEAYPPEPNNQELDCHRALERVAFKFGANAILAEIEGIIIDKFPNKRETILCLIEKIKELKGKQL